MEWLAPLREPLRFSLASPSNDARTSHVKPRESGCVKQPAAGAAVELVRQTRKAGRGVGAFNVVLLEHAEAIASLARHEPDAHRTTLGPARNGVLGATTWWRKYRRSDPSLRRGAAMCSFAFYGPDCRVRRDRVHRDRRRLIRPSVPFCPFRRGWGSPGRVRGRALQERVRQD